MEEQARYMGKLSLKGQVTLPKEVRDALGLHPGDVVGYRIQGRGQVSLRRVEAFDAAFHKSLSKTLDEWSTPEDEAAFRDL